jgi:hypothetical protein
VQRAPERHIGLETEDEAIGVLKIVSGLIARDETRDAVGQNHGLQGERAGAGAKAAVAVAELEADIGPGPIVLKWGVRSLDRHADRRIGGHDRVAQAERD